MPSTKAKDACIEDDVKNLYQCCQCFAVKGFSHSNVSEGNEIFTSSLFGYLQWGAEGEPL